MTNSLEALSKVDGIYAVFVFRMGGSLLGSVGTAVFDCDVVEDLVDVAKGVVDGCQEHEADWCIVDADFTDGHLALRRIDAKHVLAIVSGPERDLAMLNISSRITVKRLMREISAGTARFPSCSKRLDGSRGGSSSRGGGSSRSVGSGSRSVGSGSTRHGSGNSGDGSGLPWPAGTGGVVRVADEDVRVFLDGCVHAAAYAFGPAASVVVKSAVKRMAKGGVFGSEMKPFLVAALEAEVATESGREAFREHLPAA